MKILTYVERCLYDYKANVAEIEALRSEQNNLMSLHGHNYEMNNSFGECDPVANIVNQSLNLDKKIAAIEKRVKPVDKLLGDLKGSSQRVQQMAGILRLRYFQHEDNFVVRRELSISSTTLWRRSRELLALASHYFGKNLKYF